MNKAVLDWYWRSGVSYDSDYQTWLTQIASDGGTALTPTVKTAQNALIVSLKAGGYWTRIKTMYFLHCGDTTVGRRNVKSPSTFRMSIAGTLTFSEGNGTKSNGTDGYFNQTYPANQYAGIESTLTVIQYISESSTSNISGASHGMRTSTLSSDHRLQLTPKVSTNGNRTHYNNAIQSWANSNHKGRYIQTYESGNSIVYKNGSAVDTDAVTAVAPDIASPRFILARNSSAVGGATPTEYYPIYVAYDILMDTVTAAEAAAIDTLLATYNTAAGLP